jgi:ATP phosphoribosyltransferase
MTAQREIRLALPGKGALEAATLNFLAECGMRVNRSNPRQYFARIKNMPEVEVVFQRAADIPALVQDGDAALGITGYDILAEHRGYGDEDDEDEDDGDEVYILERDLGYGNCRLVVAVPETWIDVSACADLWHLAGYYMTQKGRALRIATKYPALTGRFLRAQGITHYKLVSPHGALEAAPLTDTADLIVDLTETGTTLRENHLKLLSDGVVLRSQACLIANAQILAQHESALRVASLMLELIEARMQARNRSLLTAYVQSESAEYVQRVCDSLRASISGIEFRRSGADEQESGQENAEQAKNWFTITGVVNMGSAVADLLEAVAALRSAGAAHINIIPLAYRFQYESVRVRELRERLQRRL